MAAAAGSRRRSLGMSSTPGRRRGRADHPFGVTAAPRGWATIANGSVDVAATSVSTQQVSRRSELRAVVLIAVVVAGILATIVTAWAVANSPILVDRTSDVIWRTLFVSAYVAVGAYTWWRRPQSQLGPLVAGAGFLYSVTSLNASKAPLAYTIGMVVWAVYIVYVGYLYLCFPRGRLESKLERGFILAFVLSAVVVWGLILLVSPTLPAGGDFTNCGTACPDNALQIVSGHADTGVALLTAADIVFTIGAIGVAMLVFNKARSPSHLRRRALTPLTIAVLAGIIEFVVGLFLRPAFPGTVETLKVINGLAGVAVPVAIFAGQVRGDLFAAVTLGQIVVREGGKSLTPAAVQTLIGEALGDSTLRLALWAPERAGYIDVGGAPLEVPRDPGVRGVTEVTRHERPVAALIHDPSLDTDSDVVQGLAASSLMLLENRRLVDELRASRSRLVETADHERRRLEQDLHDGAQQRLVTIQIKLRLARDEAYERNLDAQLEAIGVEAEAAVEELRTLAHGIYPPLLVDRGLADALRDVAVRGPIAIRVADEGIGRCPAPIETAIYFCSLEAIQNAIKHAGSRARVVVTLGHNQGGVHFTVTDDGSGMDPREARDGAGLTGMRDRIGAVGGDLKIVSSPGRGTSVQGTIPDAALPAPEAQRASPAAG